MKLFKLIAIALLFSSQAYAQLDSCNVFLKGHYIEAGINWNGAFGSSANSPSDYLARAVGNSIPNSYACDSTPRTNTRQIAIVAWPDRTTTIGGPPLFRDFIINGLPQEGWSIMADGRQTNAWNGAGIYTYQICDHNIIGSNISYTINKTKVIGVWKGTYNTATNHKLQITQVTTLDTNQIYLTLSMTIKNIDTGICNNTYYLRTLDPDNDVTLSADYTTRNVVTSKLPNPKNKVLVSTWGVHNTNMFLGLGTEDCRAKAFVCSGDLWPVNRIDSIYNGTASKVKYDSLTSDVGVGLLFSLGTISPGDSVTFSYAYIFKDSLVDYALTTNPSAWIVNNDTTQHTSGDTVDFCGAGYLPVDIQNSNYNTWNWSSPTGNYISSLTGTHINVFADTTTAVFVAIGSGSSACLNPDTVIMILKPVLKDTIPTISINGTHAQSTGNYVTLNASITHAGTGHRIVWRKNGIVILSTAIGTTITYTKPAGNDTITATIIPLNYCYDTAVSNTWIVYNNTAVGQINPSGYNIQVYPNPLTNEMTISALSVADQVTVYDIMGRKVQNWIITKEGTNTFNTATLLHGMYIIRVLDKDGNVKARLPIQKL